MWFKGASFEGGGLRGAVGDDWEEITGLLCCRDCNGLSFMMDAK